MRKVKLSQIDPAEHPLCKSKDEAHKVVQGLQKKIYDLLYLMYAHNRYSLLIILHGIDTSGKDGSVRHIFSAANPQGIKVFSFKKPSTEESRHDFIWRCHKHTPESGLTTIFNRSYYEEVTTTQVHPKLLEKQNIPNEFLKKPDFFDQRYERINDFEKLLAQKGTKIVKFYLHISKKEQKIRIQERLKNRSKNWKFSLEDIQERRHWNKYMSSYEKMLNATNTTHAPWTIIPADNKWYRDFLISKTIFDQLKNLKMSFPVLSDSNKSF
ncbi:MAG: PPK2 family polyphosphate kinase [Bdellovibrionota bacterium]